MTADTTTARAEGTVAVRLYDLAHSRAGDKGNRLNLSLIALAPGYYSHLVAQVTEARVLELFSHRGASRVRRYLLPTIDAMNFVIDDVLEGGVNASLNLDGHGKTLSFRLLSLVIHVPRDELTPYTGAPWPAIRRSSRPA